MSKDANKILVNQCKEKAIQAINEMFEVFEKYMKKEQKILEKYPKEEMKEE